MAIRKKGNTNLRITNVETIADPETGLSQAITFEGMRDVIANFAAQFRGSVSPCRTSQVQGPWWRAVVVVSGSLQTRSEPASDTWSRSYEYVQEDIRNNALVQSSVGGSLNEWVKEFKEKIKDGIDLAYINNFRQAMFELFSRGAEAYESHRIVLRRRRVIPVNYASPATVAGIENIYTSGRLISAFNIPVDARRLMPAVPNVSPPNNTAWSWKTRANTSDLVLSTGKVEEVMEWTFAAWSTILYNLLS